MRRLEWLRVLRGAGCVFSFSFGLVWRAVTGNGCNLPSGQRLSTTIYCKAENKFSLFPCQARNPSNHKVFRRFNAREVTGKYFPPAHNSGKIRRVKSQASPRSSTSEAVDHKRRILSNQEASTTRQARQGSNGRKEARKEASPQPRGEIIPITYPSR
jgi:hypothetical protein